MSSGSSPFSSTPSHGLNTMNGQGAMGAYGVVSEPSPFLHSDMQTSAPPSGFAPQNTSTPELISAATATLMQYSSSTSTEPSEEPMLIDSTSGPSLAYEPPIEEDVDMSPEELDDATSEESNTSEVPFTVHAPVVSSQDASDYANTIIQGHLALQPESVGMIPDGNENLATDFDRNLDFIHFVQQWVFRTKMSLNSFPFPETSLQTGRGRRWAPPAEVLRADLHEERCDPQGMNWEELGIPRAMAVLTQLASYGNFTTRGVMGNVTTTRPDPCGSSVLLGPAVFQFRSFRSKPKPWVRHFQLRHLLSVASKYEVYYTGQHEVFRYNGALGGSEQAMDLGQRTDNAGDHEAMQIMCLSGTDGILVAGGYGGDYGLLDVSSSSENVRPVRGLVSEEQGITNHVHTSFGRSSTYPQAIFSSNDGKVRTLDCHTNRIIQEQDLTVPVNCAATSADGRWRVTVGDETTATVSSAEGGRICARLHGHRDFGFACAWSDDNVHVATASQERCVLVWDARNFRQPLKKIRTCIGAARNLQFSSTGSGPRQLLMMEPAHTFSVIEARTFEHEQRFTQFGQLAGAGFTPDGDNLFVGNPDQKVGGIMHYERTAAHRINIDQEERSGSDLFAPLSRYREDDPVML